MRRLPALALAFAVAAVTLAAGPGAVAKDHRDGGGRAEQRGGEPARGRGGEEGRWAGRGGPPVGWRGNDGHGGEQRVDPRFDPRNDPRNDPRYEQRYDPRNDPRAAAPPQGYMPRRGGYLGPQSGAPIEDPGRFRLRAAPRGYAWVRVPGGMAMVSQATGQVFDIVPDGR